MLSNQIYIGEISRPGVRESIENAKLILFVGALKSDFNTGNFSYHIQKDRTIEVRRFDGASTTNTP